MIIKNNFDLSLLLLLHAPFAYSMKEKKSQKLSELSEKKRTDLIEKKLSIQGDEQSILPSEIRALIYTHRANKDAKGAIHGAGATLVYKKLLKKQRFLDPAITWNKNLCASINHHHLDFSKKHQSYIQDLNFYIPLQQLWLAKDESKITIHKDPNSTVATYKMAHYGNEQDNCFCLNIFDGINEQGQVLFCSSIEKKDGTQNAHLLALTYNNSGSAKKEYKNQLITACALSDIKKSTNRALICTKEKEKLNLSLFKIGEPTPSESDYLSFMQKYPLNKAFKKVCFLTKHTAIGLFQDGTVATICLPKKDGDAITLAPQKFYKKYNGEIGLLYTAHNGFDEIIFKEISALYDKNKLIDLFEAKK